MCAITCEKFVWEKKCSVRCFFGRSIDRFVRSINGSKERKELMCQMKTEKNDVKDKKK